MLFLTQAKGFRIKIEHSEKDVYRAWKLALYIYLILLRWFIYFHTLLIITSN
jgi:hypothetical protein